MNITVINNEQEYQLPVSGWMIFLRHMRTNWTRLPEKADREFRLLALVIGDYENKHYPLPKADPIEFIKFMMEQKCLKVKDIADCFGSTHRAYEVLNRKRNLTLAMIRKLRVALGVRQMLYWRQ